MNRSTDEFLDLAKVSFLYWDDQVRDQLGKVISRFLSGGKSVVPVVIRGDVIGSVLRVVENRKTQTIVVEEQYVDADYLESFARHYSRSFQPRLSKCMRLHFFKRKIGADELLTMSDATKADYLGYCVLRPTGNQFVGRTVLSPPDEPKHDTRFIPAATRFSAHLFGHDLYVTGAPFIQQDAVTFICAGAAIWTVSYFMHVEHHSDRFFPAQITDVARDVVSHGQIRKGLTAEQISTTLHRMGLNPYVEEFNGLQQLRKTNPGSHRVMVSHLRDILHVFVDSGIPPILGYWSKNRDGHAVAVVGHDIQQRIAGAVPQLPSGYLYNSAFVDTFYVMDDNRGPYESFSVMETADPKLPSLEECDRVSIIAPTPPHVSLSFKDIRRDILRVIQAWNLNLVGNGGNVLTNLGIEPDDYKLRPSERNPLVLRTALLDSRAWKRQVIASDLPGWLIQRYQSLLLPKHVWVTEIGEFNEVNCALRSERKIHGEAILDATANPHWPGDGLVSFHNRGLIMDASRDVVQAKWRLCATPFSPYSPIRRSQ